MALVTIQVIEGLERGSVFENIPTPISIGREDDNRIRLNDERVSRFHAKIQEDAGRIILTDLDSTNGTRCNGQPVQMRVLQPGDQLTIGRCMLVYGSRAEIADRMEMLAARSGSDVTRRPDEAEDDLAEDGTYYAHNEPGFDEFEESGLIPRKPLGTALFPRGAPPLPSGLTAAQRAELSDYLAYVHDQIQNVVQTSCEIGPSAQPGELQEGQGEGMFLAWIGWQRLLLIEADLATALQKTANPDH